MKKITYLLLLSSCVFADEISEIEEQTQPKFHHELCPNYRWVRHKETGFSYMKHIGGFEYNYFKPYGLNFNSFFGYSFFRDKTFVLANWGLKYIYGVKNSKWDLYPIAEMSNISHYSTTNGEETYQIYRSAFFGGLGTIFHITEKFALDAHTSYFKDLATSCILHKGDEFWGKNYYSPSGFKISLVGKYTSWTNKPLEVGAYYSRTFKNIYKEYGLKSSIAFQF